MLAVLARKSEGVRQARKKREFLSSLTFSFLIFHLLADNNTANC